MHVRTQIRNKIKETLTGLPTTGDNVFIDFYSISDKRMPCISILVGSDTYERTTLGKPALLDVNTEIKIYGAVKVTDVYQDVADQLLLEIQKAINDDVTLHELVKSAKITNVDVNLDYEQDKPICFVEVFLQVAYRIREDNPEVII